MITALLFLPSIMKVLGSFLPFHSVVWDSFVALTSYTNYLYYPTFEMLYVGGGLVGLPVFILTVLFVYEFSCMAVAMWGRTFDRLMGDKSRICQIMAFTALLVIFVYHAIYMPSLTASRFTVETNVPAEISISKAPAIFHDGDGSFQKYVIKEFFIRNNNDFEMVHAVPHQAPVMCLYDTRSGALQRYGGYYADETGHGFVDAPNWNNIIVAPQSEARYYLLGDMKLSEEYDEILLPRRSYWPPNKDCPALTDEDIADSTGTIIKISR